MNRYFEIVGKKQTLALNIKEGSPAAKATSEEISKAYCLTLREIDRQEYQKLTKQYSQ